MSKIEIAGNSCWFQDRNNKNLTVQRLALVQWLPNEGEEKSGQSSEDEEGCDPGFLFDFGKQVCATLWSRLESRACTAVLHVVDARGVQYEIHSSFFVWLSVWSPAWVSSSSTSGMDDAVNKQV